MNRAETSPNLNKKPKHFSYKDWPEYTLIHRAAGNYMDLLYYQDWSEMTSASYSWL